MEEEVQELKYVNSTMMNIFLNEELIVIEEAVMIED